MTPNRIENELGDYHISTSLNLTDSNMGRMPIELVTYVLGRRYFDKVVYIGGDPMPYIINNTELQTEELNKYFDKVFTGCKGKFKSLVLSSCGISRLPVGLLVGLNDIYIYSCPYLVIDDIFKHSAPKRLEINTCGLTTFLPPPKFARNLEFLCLHNNQILHISPHLFDKRELRMALKGNLLENFLSKNGSLAETYRCLSLDV